MIVMTEEEDLYDAYVFAFPLVIMDATMRHMTNVTKSVNTAAPMGRLGHSSILANAESRFVVTPNVDTLYSVGYLDLFECSYILDIPKADRYVSYELLDGYTDCIAVFGSGMERDHGRFFITGPKNDDKVPEGCEIVKVPTSLVWMIVRTICSDPNDKEEMEQIDRIRGKISLTPSDGCMLTEGVYRQEYDYTPVKYVLGMSADEFFDSFNELSVNNPPSKDDEDILKRIAYLGIGPGLDFDPERLSDKGLEYLVDIGKKFAMNIAKSKSVYQHNVNGWSYWDHRMAEFGTEYEYRALVALGGLGANPVKMAIYPFCEEDANGDHLNGKNEYVMHMDSLPPTEEFGFWSFTLYGDDDFLVANPIDRYCINDRSDLKFNKDGSLDVNISAEDKGKDNWLPCSKDGFHIVLRVYLPGEQVLSESWMPPSVVKR